MNWPWHNLTLSFWLETVPVVAGLAAIVLALARRYRTGIVLLLLAAAIPRFYLASEPNIRQWDEAYHLLVAKHFVLHPLVPTLYDQTPLPYDRHDWNSNHVWVHKQPLTMWLMAASMRCLGVSVFAARVPSAILSTLSIGLTYLIGRRLFDAPSGLFAALFHACTPYLIVLACGREPTDHIDTALLFFVELGVYCAVRNRDRPGWRWALLTGAVAGLAFLTKWSVGLIVLPIWLILVVGTYPWKQQLRDAGLVALATVALAAPWQIYIHTRFPDEAAYEHAYNVRHIHEVIEGHVGDAWWHLNNVPETFGWAAFLAPVLFLAALRGRQRGPWAVLAWLLGPYAFFSYVATKMPAYVMIAAPALFLMEGRICAFACVKRRHWMIGVGAALAAAMLLCYPLENIREYTHDVARDPLRPEPALLEMQRLGGVPHGPKTVLFNCPPSVITMFVTDFVAYDGLPDADEIDKLRRQGYQVWVYAPPAQWHAPEGARVMAGRH